jgi:hypothetical protein
MNITQQLQEYAQKHAFEPEAAARVGAELSGSDVMTVLLNDSSNVE